MQMKKYAILLLSVIPALQSLAAIPVNFDKIEHWTGAGPNRAALVITNDAGASDPKAYVWGYRWEDGDEPTGETMFRAICANSTELVLLTQLTGIYGSTVCGIGFGDADTMLDNIYFDFDMAKDYEFINFDYYHASSFFGQSEAPGDNAPVMAAEAIEKARISGSHVIDHPFNHAAYGYPAYDYDCWFMRDAGFATSWWTSAWYTGYWSYWTGSEGGDDWMYSGTGFSGRRLTDGSIDAWSYTQFENPGVGGFGEGTPPAADPAMYSYRPISTASIPDVIVSDENEPAQWFDISGRRVSSAPLIPGIYIRRQGDKAEKILVK